MVIASTASRLPLTVLRVCNKFPTLLVHLSVSPSGRRCDWVQESLSWAVGLLCCRQQLPPPQATCGFLWNQSLGQSTITNEDGGATGHKDSLEGDVGKASFSAGAARPAGIAWQSAYCLLCPTLSLPLKAGRGSACASQSLLPCSAYP